MCCHSPTCNAIAERNATRWCLFRLHFVLRAKGGVQSRSVGSVAGPGVLSLKDQPSVRKAIVAARNGIVVVPRSRYDEWLDASRDDWYSSTRRICCDLKINLSGFPQNDHSRRQNARFWLIADQWISSVASKIYTFQIVEIEASAAPILLPISKGTFDVG